MFGIYIHFPFCRKRCPYCDFAVTAKKNIPDQDYTDWIIQEIEKKSKLFSGRKITSIYFGGGTPSLWKAKSLRLVLDAIRRVFNQEKLIDCEITIESDPLDLQDFLLAENWKKLGINRLSIGGQSLNDQRLQNLGRLHRCKDIYLAMQNAKKLGFENISMDLMIGQPNQSLAELNEELEALVALSPNHISIYQLTVEPKTLLEHWVKKKQVIMPDDEKQVEAYLFVREKMKREGYQQYEISAFAKSEKDKDFRSRHNRLYWNCEEYMGVGVSAHSFLKLETGNALRWWNSKSLQGYSEEIKSELENNMYSAKKKSLVFKEETIEEISMEQMRKDALWLGLRQIEGIHMDSYAKKYGEEPIKIFPALQKLKEEGFIDIFIDRISLTEKGILFADTVAEKII